MNRWLSNILNVHIHPYIAVREMPGEVEGCHILVHVPEKHRSKFKREFAKWVAYGSHNYSNKALHMRDADDRALSYLMKGGTESVRQHFGVYSHWRADQGILSASRVKISHAIGKTARERAEWEEIL